MFDVKVIKNGFSNGNEFEEYKNLLRGQKKENVCKNLLKIEFSKWMQSIVVGSGISIIDTTDKIINDIDFNNFKDSGRRSNTLFTKIVFGGLIRVAFEASLITNVEYSDILNGLYSEVVNTCNNIISLLNAE